MFLADRFWGPKVELAIQKSKQPLPPAFQVSLTVVMSDLYFGAGIIAEPLLFRVFPMPTRS